MVESSSTAGVNKAQLVGTHDGKVIVPVYDWSAFLGQYFVKLPGIKKFHYFRFSKEEPGKIYFKEYSTSPERSLLLLKHPATLPPAVLPAKVNPQGLSQERKQYLHREIRQFCKPGTEDLVAPAPWSLWSSIRQCSTVLQNGSFRSHRALVRRSGRVQVAKNGSFRSRQICKSQWPTCVIYYSVLNKDYFFFNLFVGKLGYIKQ